MLTVATIRNETGIVDIQSQFNSTEFFQSLLKDETAVEAYDRQVYYIGVVSEDILFLMYTGSKYSIRYISGEVLTNTNGETLAKPHAFCWFATCVLRSMRRERWLLLFYYAATILCFM